MEQDTGVEPASAAWEAAVLPMYESCVGYILSCVRVVFNRILPKNDTGSANRFCIFLKI